MVVYVVNCLMLVDNIRINCTWRRVVISTVSGEPSPTELPWIFYILMHYLSFCHVRLQRTLKLNSR